MQNNHTHCAMVWKRKNGTLFIVRYAEQAAFSESVGAHRIYRKSHEKLGNVSMECHHRIPSALIYSSIRNIHTHARARICKSCLKCITFGPIVCLGVAFRANFIPGKVEVAQLTSMQMAEEGVRRALLYI